MESLDFALLGGVLHSHSHGDGRAVAHRRLRLREDADQSPQALDFTAFEQLARQCHLNCLYNEISHECGQDLDRICAAKLVHLFTFYYK